MAFHQECPINRFGANSSKIAHAHSFSAHTFMGTCNCDEPKEVTELFAITAQKLRQIVTEGDNHPEVKTEVLLKRFCSAVNGFGNFASQQIFPLAVLLGLSTNLHRSLHASIPKKKKHHTYMDEVLGLKSEASMTAVMECVAEHLDTHPVKVENCLCEHFRQNDAVLDFFFPTDVLRCSQFSFA